MTMQLRLGWDVGAWHCENGDSRDGLFLLERTDQGVRQVGRCWRGNLRKQLVSHDGDTLLRSLLDLCGHAFSATDDLVIAIDAPLGWPVGFRRLLTCRDIVPLVEDDPSNPYTRRLTDMDLCARGYRPPLSSVRDMIGSQSTKALHFLRAAHLTSTAGATWSREQGALRLRAIEAYPAAASHSALLLRAMKGLGPLDGWTGVSRLGDKARADIRDAAICAALAHLWADCPGSCAAVPNEVPEGEGWIILPVDARPVR